MGEMREDKVDQVEGNRAGEAKQVDEEREEAEICGEKLEEEGLSGLEGTGGVSSEVLSAVEEPESVG